MEEEGGLIETEWYMFLTTAAITLLYWSILPGHIIRLFKKSNLKK